MALFELGLKSLIELRVRQLPAKRRPLRRKPTRGRDAYRLERRGGIVLKVSAERRLLKLLDEVQHAVEVRGRVRGVVSRAYLRAAAGRRSRGLRDDVVLEAAARRLLFVLFGLSIRVDP